MSTENSFGSWLKERRQALDLTQGQLAEQVGCTDEMIRKIEAGRRRPSQQIAELLATKLGIPPAEQEQFVQFARGVADASAPVIAPAPSAPAPRRSGLPLLPTTLIGREHEQEQLVEMLLAAKPRLITVTGPPGMGKTSIALSAATAVQRHFSDGVFFIPLAPLSDAALVASTIARALGVSASGDRPLVESLHDFLWTRHILLVLDNFEQILGAAPLVAEMLQLAPRLKILVTSRAVLRLRGEKEFVLAPLGLPDRGQPLAPDELGDNPAVRLFVERAAEARSDFALTPENAATVAEITRRLEGLPLAIELAAARIRLLPPKVMLERLQHRLQILADGHVDLPERQQTLRNAIDWSYDLLAPAERRLFYRLAAFRGGSALEAAETVAGGDQPGTLATLGALVRMSMLRVTEADGPARFWMLEMIREYALEKLEASGEANAVRAAHAAFFLTLAETAAAELTGPNQAAWFDRLELEHDNLRAALHWALDCREAALALRLGAALWRFWWIRSHIEEGKAWLTEALALVPAAEQPADARATALGGAGILTREVGDFPESRRLLEESLALRRAGGDGPAVADALTNLGVAAMDQEQYGEARDLLQEAVALARQLNARWPLSRSLLNLSTSVLNLGDPEAARLLLDQALTLSRELGNKANVATSLHNLGVVMYEIGDNIRARSYYEEALLLRRELGNKTRVAASLSNLGLILYELGERAAGREMLDEALALKRAVSGRAEIAGTLRELATIMLDEGDYGGAGDALRESLRLFSAAGSRDRIAGVLPLLAGVAAAQGHPARAARMLGAAELLREERGSQMRAADLPRYNRILAAGQDATTPEAWAAAWAAGRREPLEQTVELALRAE